MDHYVPTNFNNYLLHRTAVSSLKSWLTEFQSGKRKRGGVFIIGPPGSGKTVLSKLLLREFGYDIVEFQPDCTKTHKVEMTRLRNIIQTQNVGMMFNQHKKGILFDDIEVGANNDRGFLPDVIQLVERQQRYSNPIIFTLNVNVKTKKLSTIEKYVHRVYLNRISQYEMFQVGKQIVKSLQITLPDYRLQFLANRCQGDLRCLYQGLEVHMKTMKQIVNKLTEEGSASNTTPDDTDSVVEIPDTEAWDVYSKKELEVNPLYSIENLLIPTNQAKYHQYLDIYDADTLFSPANVYENTWPVLQNIKFKQSDKRDQTYQKIMESISSWITFDPNFSDPCQLLPTEYAMVMSVYQPLHLLRQARSTRTYSTHRLKTSNMYSRISQSSFNRRSMKELSQLLQISTQEFYECSYALMKILPVNLTLVASYLQKFDITRTNMERIFKYNCVYKQMEKTITSKQKSALKKLLKTI
jgi:Cdc6-like AAA superfamily ATPase